jgi:predicted alpha/beta-hydrolase family hydrolase
MTFHETQDLRTYAPSARLRATPTLVLAHGAGAGHDHPWMTRVAQGLAGRGVRVVTFNFPYTAAGRRVPDRAPVLENAFAQAWREVAASNTGRLVAGGKSMGGRIASQVTAKGGFDPAPAALVFFGYPLHPPGKPGQRRDRHLPDIDVPTLFLHGTRDPFGTPEEMRKLVAKLPAATLELIEGGDHSLLAPKRVDPTGASFEQALDRAAAFILATA